MADIIFHGRIPTYTELARAAICSRCKTVVSFVHSETKSRRIGIGNTLNYIDCPTCKGEIDTAVCYEIKRPKNPAKQKTLKRKCQYCGNKFRYLESAVLVDSRGYSNEEFTICPNCLNRITVNVEYYDDGDVDDGE